MKFAASNILWHKGTNHFEEFLKVLNNLQFDGVEIALSCLWEEPKNISIEELSWLKNLTSQYELEICSLHSLTFTRPDLTLFGEKNKREELIEYVQMYQDFSKILDCPNITFGSPKARIKGQKTKSDAENIFIEFLGLLDKNLETGRVNIEPLPTSYCDFLNHYQHATEIIDMGNFKNIGIQLDLKAIHLTESWDAISQQKSENRFHHVQVSDLDFSIPSEKDLELHNKLHSFLKSINYQGFISVEAVESEKEQIINKLRKFREIYA